MGTPGKVLGRAAARCALRARSSPRTPARFVSPRHYGGAVLLTIAVLHVWVFGNPQPFPPKGPPFIFSALDFVPRLHPCLETEALVLFISPHALSRICSVIRASFLHV